MVDPKNYREVAIDLTAFKREVDPQFRFLNQMFFSMGALLVGVIGGGIAIYVQIGDLKALVAGGAHDIAAINERLAKIEKSTSDAVSSQNQIVAVLTRIVPPSCPAK